MPEQQFPLPAQLVMAEIRQTGDLGLQDCVIAFTPGHLITPGVAFCSPSRLSNPQFDRFGCRRSSPRAGEVSASCGRCPREILAPSASAILSPSPEHPVSRPLGAEAELGSYPAWTLS